MRQSLSLKPQDVAILLKLLVTDGVDWRQVDISIDLGISQGEVAKSLSRLKSSGLIFEKKVNRSAAVEFLIHGFKYTFPVELGPLAVGVPTAMSAPSFKSKILQGKDDIYVWPSSNGNVRGQIITPLYPKLAEAALKDKKFYELFAAVEVLRVGRSRERKIAEQEIKMRLKVK